MPAKEKFLFNKSIRKGIIRTANQNGINSDMDDQDLLLIAKRYAQRKTAYWSKKRSYTQDKAREIYRKEVKNAFFQLKEYQAFISQREEHERYAERRRQTPKSFVEEEQKSHYEDLRDKEYDSTKLMQSVSLAVAVALCFMLGSLFLNYTPYGDPIREWSTQRATVTVYSHGDSFIDYVEVGHESDLAANQNRQSVEVQDSNQFELSIKDVSKGDSLSVLVRGTGVVGCRIRLEETGIVVTNRAEANEVVCDATSR